MCGPGATVDIWHLSRGRTEVGDEGSLWDHGQVGPDAAAGAHSEGPVRPQPQTCSAGARRVPGGTGLLSPPSSVTVPLGAHLSLVITSVRCPRDCLKGSPRRCLPHVHESSSLHV